MHERLASPLYAFAFVLLVMASMGQAQTTRQSRMQAVIGAFTIAIVCRVIGIATTNAVVVRPHLSGLVYAVPVAAAALAVASIQWHLYPRPPSRLARMGVRLVDGIGALFATLWPRRPLPQAVRRMGG